MSKADSTAEAEHWGGGHRQTYSWPYSSLAIQFSPSVSSRLSERGGEWWRKIPTSAFDLYMHSHMCTQTNVLFHEGTVANMLCSWFYFTETVSLEYVKEELKRSTVFSPPKSWNSKKNVPGKLIWRKREAFSFYLPILLPFLLLLHPCFPHFHSSDGDHSLEC